jgi:hypothetical protein
MTSHGKFETGKERAEADIITELVRVCKKMITKSGEH